MKVSEILSSCRFRLLLDSRTDVLAMADNEWQKRESGSTEPFEARSCSVHRANRLEMVVYKQDPTPNFAHSDCSMDQTPNAFTRPM